MSFFQRLFDVMPAWVAIGFAVALAAFVVLAGYERLAARRKDAGDDDVGPAFEARVTDRRPADPPDVEAVAMPSQFAAADHERALAAHSAAVGAILDKPKPRAKRMNRNRRHK